MTTVVAFADLSKIDNEQVRYFKLIDFLNEQTRLIEEEGEDNFQKLYFDLSNFILNEL